MRTNHLSRRLAARPNGKLRAGLTLGTATAMLPMLLLGCATDFSEEEEAPESTTEVSEEVVETSELPTQLTGEACLSGTWQMQLDTFAGSLEQLMRASGEIPADMAAGLSVELDGHSFVRFDGVETYTAWVDDYTMTVTVAGQSMVHHQNSGESATYGVVDDITWIAAPVNIFFEATMTPVGGVSVELGEEESARVNAFGVSVDVPGVDRELIDGTARFACEGDSLTLTGDFDVSAVFRRAPEGTQPNW